MRINFIAVRDTDESGLYRSIEAQSSQSETMYNTTAGTEKMHEVCEGHRRVTERHLYLTKITKGSS
jgi:hypothetical protein